MRFVVFAVFALSSLLASCEPAPVVGVACMYPSDCRRPLVCRFGRCRNECELNRDCPIGATCLLDARGDGSCGVTQDDGCEIGISCDDALACVNDRCVTRCSDASDCPEDGVCAAASGTGVNICFDVRAEIPDAARPDASRSDAGPVDAGIDAPQTDAGTAMSLLEMCIGPDGMCALRADQRVYCWGGGNNGRNGDGTEEDRMTPVSVLGPDETPLVGIDHIACGASFGCAHEAHTGHVLCWGDGSRGELGVDRASSDIAVEVADDDPRELVSAVGGDLSAAGYHVCVLDTEEHALLCWGDNSGLIDISHPFVMMEPLPPSPPIGPGVVGNVIDFGVASGGACVVRIDGSVACWGENEHGETGAEPFTTLPALVGLTPVALAETVPYSLAVGWNHRASLLAPDGELASWGTNRSLQLGDDAAGDTATPVPAAIGTPRFTRIAADGFSDTSCGVISGESGAMTGRVRCWGDNNHGQAGLGATSPAFVEPDRDVIVESTAMPLENVERVFVGPVNACAITRTGELWCWGRNSSGQLGLPPDDVVRRAVPITFPAP